MFPEELPRRLIKMFSFAGETVADPFAGSGTTSLAAKNLGRQSIGYEVNPEYVPFIKEKLQVEQQDMNETTYEFIQQQKLQFDAEKKIADLPYIFKDPHTLDKKIDVKKRQFGSRIDSNNPAIKEELFTVKEVISAEKVRLSNGAAVRLIGIKENPAFNGEATAFLTKKLKGKRVFLKHDNLQNDEEQTLFCYLYLENKTFVNAHLMKSGLVQLDESFDFKHKQKFLKLYQESTAANDQ
jgi:site-specific DNA-methyltransferase (adenine-specific)